MGSLAGEQAAFSAFREQWKNRSCITGRSSSQRTDPNRTRPAAPEPPLKITERGSQTSKAPIMAVWPGTIVTQVLRTIDSGRRRSARLRPDLVRPKPFGMAVEEIGPATLRTPSVVPGVGDPEETPTVTDSGRTTPDIVDFQKQIAHHDHARIIIKPHRAAGDRSRVEPAVRVGPVAGQQLIAHPIH